MKRREVTALLLTLALTASLGITDVFHATTMPTEQEMSIETEVVMENETENEINKYDRVRFVKMENGEWELDLSFVENHES